MAFNYVRCELRGSDYSVTGSEQKNSGYRSVKSGVKVDFLVRIIPTEGESPDQVTEAWVAANTGLPVVNYTAYYSTSANLIIPYLICTSKSVKRRKENGFLFDASCSFETDQLDSELATEEPPATIDDIEAQMEFRIGEYQRVLYHDKEGTPCWKIPYTKTPFQNPIVEKLPTLTAIITQYEDNFTHFKQMQRSFKCNDAVWGGYGAGQWMIQAVAAVEQEVQLASGPVTANKVTYTVSLSERFYYAPGAPATAGNETTYGWDMVQPLVDTMKMSTDLPDGVVGPTEPRLVPMTDAYSGNVRSGYINPANGFERVAPEGTDEDRPDYLRFRTQDRIPFSFLKKEPT